MEGARREGRRYALSKVRKIESNGEK